MNVCPKQLVVTLVKDNAVRMKPGAMQMMLGQIQMTSDFSFNPADMAMKHFKAKATKDSAYKTLWQGNGTLICEPSYMWPIIEDIADWGGTVILEDGLFLACDDEIKENFVIGNMSQVFGSAVGTGEGNVNLQLKGSGHFVINSKCPREEIWEIQVQNDEVKIDGNNAICWSGGLTLTTELATNSVMGNMKGKEGLVNVFRGTGKIFVKPIE